METKLIFADDMKSCPQCGSMLFQESWADGGSEDEELMYIECLVCGASYYGRDYYERTHGLADDEEIPF